MIYRVTRFSLVSSLYLCSLFSHASVSPPILSTDSPETPPQCKVFFAEGFQKQDVSYYACINFFQDESFKDYTAHLIYKGAPFSEQITNILENKANSNAVFFLADDKYRPTEPLYINNANVAFVGISRLPDSPAKVIFLQPSLPSHEQTGSFFRYDKPDGHLLFHNISFDDDVSEVTLLVGEEPVPYHTSLVNIKSARSVKANKLSINSFYHQRALSFDCDGKAPATDVSIVNSRAMIPAKNAYGISFHCTRKEHTFKVQYAFSRILLNTDQLLLQSHHNPSFNTGSIPTSSTPTSSTTTPTPKQTNTIKTPEADIAVFVDVAGNIEFHDSVCNSVYHTDKGSWYSYITPAFHEQVLFVTRPESFKGSLSTNIDGSKIGSNYSPEQKTFDMAFACPESIDNLNKNDLHFYQPEANPSQSESESVNLISQLYEQRDYYKAMTYTFAAVTAVGVFTVMGIFIKYRKPIWRAIRGSGSSHTPDAPLVEHQE